ncbi:MAG: NUDIX domain-containing protein [Candidatus Thorarchaeota archaeon]|jgi:8-oxo-dGTP diphosphatase
MSNDRFIYWQGRKPKDQDELMNIIQDFFGVYKSGERWLADFDFDDQPNMWVIFDMGKYSHPLQRVHETYQQRQEEQAEDDRKIEIHINNFDKCIDILTRQADPVTNGIADKLATTIASWYQASLQTSIKNTNYADKKHDIKKPIYATDIVIFSHEGAIFNDATRTFKSIRDNWEILLIKRKYQPFMDSWALPGGCVEEGETSEQAAYRESKEETSIDLSEEDLTLVGIFDKPDRDPRGWAISCSYFAIVDPAVKLYAKGQDDAKEAKWFPLKELPELAFDHLSIIQSALSKLQNS